MYYIYQKYINTCISGSDAMTTKENKHMRNMNTSDFLNQQEVLHGLLRFVVPDKQLNTRMKPIELYIHSSLMA